MLYPLVVLLEVKLMSNEYMGSNLAKGKGTCVQGHIIPPQLLVRAQAAKCSMELRMVEARTIHPLPL